MFSNRRILPLLLLVLCLGLTAGCSDDDDPVATTTRVFVGTGHFGIGRVPQLITIVINGDASTFAGSVTTDNVPSGQIFSGVWSGSRATWQTRENGFVANWEATLANGELNGNITNLEFDFMATRT